MSKCYENFSMFDDFLTPQFPDDLLPLLNGLEVQKTPDPSSTENQSANLDIIVSKFLNDGELNDIELQQLSQKERQVFEEVQRKSLMAKKRPDQYQKLFYRRAFKYAEREFFGKKNKNKSRKMSGFYHYYFGSTAKCMNIPLINFYHPDKKTRPGLRVGQKSFNRSYVKLLLRSDVFREVSRAYRGRFYQECVEQRQKKVGTFVSYLKGVVNKYGSDRNKMRQAIRSSKCKVPWNNHQIAEADRRALDDLQRYQFQSSETGGDEEEASEEVDDFSDISHEMIAEEP